MRFATMLLLGFLLTGLLGGPAAQAQPANDSAAAEVTVQLPNGQEAKRDTLGQGESFTFSGFPFPLQYLNGGTLTLPDSSLTEDISITVKLPDLAVTNQSDQSVNFGDSLASAVTFEVTVEDSAASPYHFERPVELTLPIPEELPAAVGDQVSQMVLTFVEEGGVFDTTAVKTTVRDSTQGILTAEISHFSTVGMTSEENVEEEEETTATEELADLPRRITLEPNYPNPFNPSTVIRYSLPQTTEIQLTVYNAVGQKVRVLAQGQRPAGRHAVRFQAGDLPSGLYFYRLQAGQKIVKTRAMILAK